MMYNTLYTYKTYHLYRFKKDRFFILCDNESRLYTLYLDNYVGDKEIFESNKFKDVYEYLVGITNGTTK